MFDRTSIAYRQLISDIADAVAARIVSAIAATSQSACQISPAPAPSGVPRSLTAREEQILAEILAGCSNRTIGKRLGISPRTVEVHRARIMEKYQVNSVVALVRVALSSSTPLRGDAPGQADGS